jgi:hypothetical protein
MNYGWLAFIAVGLAIALVAYLVMRGTLVALKQSEEKGE